MIHYTTCDAGKNMRQECRVKEKESDSSAGRKHETICCWLPAVPPLSLLTFHLFFLPISPAVYEGTQSVSVREPVYTQSSTTQERFSFSWFVTLYFIFTLPSYSFTEVAFTPLHLSTHAFFCHCLSVTKQTCRQETHTHNTQQTHKPHHATVRGSL